MVRPGCRPTLAAELSATAGSRLARYPASTLTTILLNQRPSHPEFRDPAVRTALLAAIDRAGHGRVTSGRRWRRSPTTRSRPARWLFDAAADPAVPFSTADAEKALKKAGWTKKADGWHLPAAKTPLTIEVLSPTADANPAAWAAADAVVEDWKALGLDVIARRPARIRVRHGPAGAGVFAAAVDDVNDRPRPGPVSAAGVEPDPERRLERHRRPGPGPRQAAGEGPQARHGRGAQGGLLGAPDASSGRAATCSRWPSRTRSWWPATRSMDPSSGRSRTVGSILGCANMAPRRRPVSRSDGSMPRWRNRQTRWFQVPVAARSCGFKSLPRYHLPLGSDITATPAQVAELVYAYV